MVAITPWSRSRSALPLPSLAARLLPLLAFVASPAGAQIFKCTDPAGNVVYQNSTCPKNASSGRVDIFDNSWTADRAEKDAAWQRTASAHHVVAGMPLNWVREALGEPAEVRKTATAGAAEVWLYNFPDRSMQVGILADKVLWSRETPVTALASPAATATEPAAAQAAGAAAEAPPIGSQGPRTAAEISRPPQAGAKAGASPEVVTSWPDALHAAPEISHSPPQPSTRISESSHGVTRGQDCSQALAELGTPDRQREVPASDSASGPTTEYFYEPAGSDNPTRTRIVCANGKVEGVDRTVIR